MTMGEQELKKELAELRQEVFRLKEEFDDHILTDEERTLVDEYLEAKKRGKLLTHKDVFG